MRAAFLIVHVELDFGRQLIFHYCNLEDHARLACVSREWAQDYARQQIWRNLLKRYFLEDYQRLVEENAYNASRIAPTAGPRRQQGLDWKRAYLNCMQVQITERQIA